MARSREPMWWSLFSAGGVVAAFLFPAAMIVTGLAVPLGWISVDGLYVLSQMPLVRVLLFVLIALPLFHWAHRFRYTAADLGPAGADRWLAPACYGTAIGATVLAAVLLAWP